ncbi:MAG: hypothetical protein RJB62_521 [Pseudomonadota bacterium]|jgi:hypothetical protein
MLVPPLFFSTVRIMFAGEDNPRGAEALAAMQERVRQWIRARFGLGADNAVLVAELKCAIPGCPPLETALAFWTANGIRHQFKLLKPVFDVTERDIDWLIGDLAREDTQYWDCC